MNREQLPKFVFGYLSIYHRQLSYNYSADVWVLYGVRPQIRVLARVDIFHGHVRLPYTIRGH